MFRVDGVRAVFFGPNFITVTRYDEVHIYQVSYYWEVGIPHQKVEHIFALFS